MALTQGINHVGLTVKDLAATTAFFIDVLGFTENGFDASYPRTRITDGSVIITLWQVDFSTEVVDFNRRQNIGLHHLALSVESESDLNQIQERIAKYSGCEIEFAPELLSGGPRKHMMFSEPGGIRIEITWNG
jgi:catechol 2,3-dioxygenase-like lactoylglutathione lyase family enzyme